MASVNGPIRNNNQFSQNGNTNASFNYRSNGANSAATLGRNGTSQANAGAPVGPNYEEEKSFITTFLLNFRSQLDETDTPKYVQMLQDLADRQRKTIPVALDDIQIFQNSDVLVNRILRNTKRYADLFADVIDANLPSPTRDLTDTEDIFDVLRLHRANELLQAQNIASDSMGSGDPTNANDNPINPASLFPTALMRRFEVHLIPPIKLKAVPIRQVKARHVGSLVRIKGMVTRVSTVKPLLTVATFTCENCAYEVYQEVKGRQFNPVVQCPSERCATNRAAGRLILQTKACKFDKYQEVKFQELPDQVPMGHIPRSLTIYLRGELTRTCEPGAVITICGIFLPLPYSAQRQMMMGLITETYLEATHVVNHKKRYSAMESSEAMEAAVLRLQEETSTDNTSSNSHTVTTLYDRLSQSIAPEIFGHEDVKKALLLLMIGGVTKQMDGGDGMKVRGDINILLMGDPGVAKSQLLKHITTIAPRGVYTTGKGSSGVGLTAAVVRDNITKEMTLEGGALVLADMGICAIDEFDKMEEADRTAIHEVMEQQTVSIAKAGITTTLNARTSVLAAANPLYGRYNKNLSASANINLPNALLSRFDLMFLILDTANYEKDEQLARHVTYVHRFAKNPDMTFEPVPPEVLRYFVAIAKQYEPVITEQLSGYIVEAYVTLRQQDVQEHARQQSRFSRFQNQSDTNSNQAQTAMTARQLLSILRLSQALARLRFSVEVSMEDVDEAIRLVYVSKASLTDYDKPGTSGTNSSGTRGGQQIHHQDVTSKIYRVLLEYARDRRVSVLSLSEVEPVVLRKGYTPQQLKACITYYQALDVMHMSDNGTSVSFVM